MSRLRFYSLDPSPLPPPPPPPHHHQFQKFTPNGSELLVGGGGLDSIDWRQKRGRI
jgi:hypothetical protein